MMFSKKRVNLQAKKFGEIQKSLLMTATGVFAIRFSKHASSRWIISQHFTWQPPDVCHKGSRKLFTPLQRDCNKAMCCVSGGFSRGSLILKHSQSSAFDANENCLCTSDVLYGMQNFVNELNKFQFSWDWNIFPGISPHRLDCLQQRRHTFLRNALKLRRVTCGLN